MARVLLLSATPDASRLPHHLALLHSLEESAARDRFGQHHLTADPAAADVILFAEIYGAGLFFEGVRRHPLTRRFREKCFLFCTNPFVIPFLPGIYTGVERRWASSRTICGFYPHMPRNPFAAFTAPTADLRYLYSFVGSVKTAAVRGQLAHLIHPRGFFQDTSSDYDRALHGRQTAEEKQEYERRYANVSRDSKFVLCPRGLSVSSMRVFETMRMGRVPVILADGWEEPPGPDWAQFSIRVPEANAAQLAQLLAEREGEAVAMGLRAREQWLEWFCEEVAFHRTVEWCLALRARRRIPEQLARWPVHLQLLRPFFFRRLLATKWRQVRRDVPIEPAPGSAVSNGPVGKTCPPPVDSSARE